MDVIRKYVAITDDHVNVQFEKGSDYDVPGANHCLTGAGTLIQCVLFDLDGTLLDTAPDLVIQVL